MRISPRATYAAVAAADVALSALGKKRARVVTKPLLMPLLGRGRDRATRRALTLSWAGDVALLGTGQAAFTAGLGSFLAGHVAWVAALSARPGCGLVRSHPALVVPYAVAGIGLNAYLWKRTGRDRGPVLIYSVALTATALAALDTGRAVTALGGALFLVSDSLLALERFADVHLPAHEGLVMATYASAQAFLASAC
jgi:uncharacterized membrane protein YhhN